MTKNRKNLSLANDMMAKGQELKNIGGTVSEVGIALIEAAEKLMSTNTSVKLPKLTDEATATGKRGRPAMLIADHSSISSSVAKKLAADGFNTLPELRSAKKPDLREMYKGEVKILNQIGNVLNYDFGRSSTRGRKSGNEPVNVASAKTSKSSRGRSPAILANMDLFSKNVKDIFAEKGLNTGNELRALKVKGIREEFKDVPNALEQIGAYLNYNFVKSGNKEAKNKTSASNSTAGKRGRKPVLLSEQKFSAKLQAAFAEHGLKTVTDLRQMGKANIIEKFGNIRGALKSISDYFGSDYTKVSKAGRPVGTTKDSNTAQTKANRRNGVAKMEISDKMKSILVENGMKYAEQIMKSSVNEIASFKRVGPKRAEQIMEAARAVAS